ncbi:helix-turn-helix domain-containing protein [Fusobacterium sp.]|uniref:winged helix-turn-helix transcriptional regulator n=1 Tax=Fusobacterium sp. TaxID=68766 RepID=UPI0029049D27|nr:helix-turn-helix domain-containing protein [Fusobacterium sp.]MDU1910852.1 helix-turn-helix domain-containing protein [Fusobacterium sp.]
MTKKMITCPLELTQEILKKKWTSIILWRLRLGSMRIRDFKKDIKGCNEKMLIEHLNELLKTGLVIKIEHEDIYPKHSEYLLTVMGWELLPILEKMQNFGIKYLLDKNLTEEKI